MIIFLKFKTSLAIAPPPLPPPSDIMTLCVRKSICDSPLICMINCYSYSINTIKFTTMPIISYLILFEDMLHHEKSPEKLQYNMAIPISRQNLPFCFSPLFFLAKTYPPEIIRKPAQFTSQSYLRNKFIVF